MELPVAQLGLESWGIIAGMFATIVGAVGHLSMRFGKLEERVKAGLEAARREKLELESWVRDIASGQTATCAKHAEKIDTLEHGAVKMATEIVKVKDDVSEVKERVAVLEAAD